jgi:hypothetical protein
MKCPDTHPKTLPCVDSRLSRRTLTHERMPFIEHDFDASAFAAMYDQAMYPGQPFVLSPGDPTGFGIRKYKFASC